MNIQAEGINPTDDEVNASAEVRQVLTWIDHTLGLPMYQDEMHSDYDDGVVTTLKTVRKMLNGTSRPDASWRSAEPQGEPSDDSHLITDCEHGVNSLYEQCAPCEAIERLEDEHLPHLDRLGGDWNQVARDIRDVISALRAAEEAKR